jgi:hypothetical protein
MRKAAAILIVLLLCGCSASKHASGPSLVSYADQQRARISPAANSGTYDSIADRLANLPQEVYAGSNMVFNETILNTGSPSKGLKILVKGSALSDGLFDPPSQASVQGIFEDKSHPDVDRTLDFKSSAAGLLATDDDLAYGSRISLNITFPAVRGGNGDVQVYVYPLEKGGQSSAVITHTYKVLSETSERQEVKVPGEDQ